MGVHFIVYCLIFQYSTYFFNLFFFEHLKFSPSLAFLFCLCTFIFISMLCLAKIYIYIFFIIALMNYSYGDRQPFSSLLIVWNKHSLKDVICWEHEINISCKFFLIVCLSCHFNVHFNFHAGRCCFGAPWEHNFICESQNMYPLQPCSRILFALSFFLSN